MGGWILPCINYISMYGHERKGFQETQFTIIIAIIINKLSLVVEIREV